MQWTRDPARSQSVVDATQNYAVPSSSDRTPTDLQDLVELKFATAM
jgi:hypothetical protein